jgi:hypothetical protein
VYVLVAEAVPFWVLGVQIEQLAPEKRPLVLALQVEFVAFLYRHFFKTNAEQVAEPATEPQALPSSQPASDSPWGRLFEAQRISQEALHETQKALRDIWQEEQAKNQQQARNYSSLAGRVTAVEAWLLSLDRRVAATQGSAAEGTQQPGLSAVHRVDIRTLLRLLEQTTGRAQMQLEHELIETFRVSAITAIPEELWQDVLAWCLWRAQRLP